MANGINKTGPGDFHFLACCIIAGVGLIVYSNTIHSGFQFDDTTNIVKNPLIRDLGNIPVFFKENGVTFPSRGLVTTTFALNYNFSGLSVEGYHWVNISLHLLNGMLAYSLALIIFTNHLSRSADGRAPTAHVLALFTGLLFVSGPTQTHSVAYIFQRNGLMASLFYLSSLIFFIRSATRSGIRPWLYAASLLSFLCATWSKEMAYSAPVIMLLYYQCFIAKEWRVAGRGLRLTLPFAVVAVMSFYLGVARDSLQITDWSLWEYLLTQANVLIEYIKLLLLPLPGSLNVDYDFQIAKTLWEFPTLLSAVSIVLILLAGAVFLSRARFFAFCILWFFIILAPTSSVVSLRDVMVVHRLYLPSLGFYLLLVVAVHSIFSRIILTRRVGEERLRQAEFVTLTCIVLFYGLCAYQHNKVWMTEITLWEDTVKKSPNKIRPHYNLGYAYQSKGMPIKAWREYFTCRRIYVNEPNIVNFKEREAYSMACNNLGVIYSDAGVYDVAIPVLKEAVRIIPRNAAAHYNLGNAYFRSGRLEPAEAEYKYAIRLRPGHEDAYGGLVAVYELRGMPREAIEAYTTAVERRPDNTCAHMGLGRLMLYYKRDTAGALYWLREAQKRCTNQNMLERVNKIVDTIRKQAIAADYPDANKWPQRNQYK